MSTAVEFAHVSKRYRLGEHHGSGLDLRDTFARLFRRTRGEGTRPSQELWSLRDVSFTVDEGQAIGIIGRNGAGKSTLLKIVSNITAPTAGRCRTRGRVGSLLEVGTGFHGELTGFENTYLNGAILGMSRREVDRRLDEIVEFAGLQRFMDTPVKRYSSGMFLRLGFAVAAHMSAEILVVDEVLAVGDAEFQRRCLGKMHEVEQSGRTVLFVSHDMDAVARLCPSAVWLDAGSIRASGDVGSVVDAYTKHTSGHGATFTADPDSGEAAQIVEAAVVDEAGRAQSVVNPWSRAWVQLDVVVREAVPGLDGAVVIATRHGVTLLNEKLSDVEPAPWAPGRYRWRYPIPSILTSGEYVVGAWVGTKYDDFHYVEDALEFSVEGDDGRLPRRLLSVGAPWTIERVDGARQGGDG